MSARVIRIRETLAPALMHSYEECGEYAVFGIDVAYNGALKALVRKDLQAAAELLGKWYCLIHWREINEKTLSI